MHVCILICIVDLHVNYVYMPYIYSLYTYSKIYYACSNLKVYYKCNKFLVYTDSTGQNTVSGPSAGFGGSGFGLGKPQPKNVTANPFGTPGSSVISSTHSGLLRSSAFGKQNILL